MGRNGRGRKVDVEYVRVVPKFLRELGNPDDHLHHDTARPIPSTRRQPGETPSVEEMRRLEDEGFVVEVVSESQTDTTKMGADANSPSHPESTTSRSNHVGKPCAVIVKPKRAARTRNTRSTLGTSNKNKLSFFDSDDDDNDD